jgi:hypothetical protein
LRHFERKRRQSCEDHAWLKQAIVMESRQKQSGGTDRKASSSPLTPFENSALQRQRRFFQIIALG